MTLLIALFAAIICTVIWYKRAPNDDMKIGTLCCMFWGASLMWMVDAVFEYSELQAEFFTPALSDMINEIYLGLSVVALGLVAWLAVLFVSDPRGVLRLALLKKR